MNVSFMRARGKLVIFRLLKTCARRTVVGAGMDPPIACTGAHRTFNVCLTTSKRDAEALVGSRATEKHDEDIVGDDATKVARQAEYGHSEKTQVKEDDGFFAGLW